MEPLAFASLAHVPILLLPIGSIRRTAFETWANEIRTFETIRLGDIPADPQEDKARFMPNPLAAGHLHLSYPSHPLPTSHLPLSLFRPSDFPLGVIGIATCTQSDSLSSILALFNATLSELFPPGSMYPLARNCFVFEESDDNTNLNLGDSLPSLVVIPSMMGNKKIYIGTLLADLCSNILGEFATLVQSLETPLGNEYLNGTMFPLLPPPSEMPKPLDLDTPARSSLPPLPSFNSQPELTTTGALRAKTPTPLSLKRNSSAGPGMPASPYRHSSLPAPTAKKKQNAIGAVSSHGRLFKVLGDLFLLAGRTMDASVWYSEAIAILKNPQDAAWHASALEGLATIPVLDAWSSTQGINDSAGDREPWSDVSDKLSQAINLYSKAAPPSDVETNYSLLSYLYSRAVIRQTSLLFAVWSAKGWGPLAFSTMLRSKLNLIPPTLAQYSGQEAQGEKHLSYSGLERLSSISGISRSIIAATISQAHGPWLLHLGSRERIMVLETMASIYASLGFKRKEAYILREVLGCVMDLIVCGREEAGGARVTGAGLGIHGINLGEGANRGTIGIRENDSSEGNESVLKIVKNVCRVHGVNLEAVNIVKTAVIAKRESAESASDNTGIDDDNDNDALGTSGDPFGWPELQIGIVREAIAVAEALPDYPAVAQFSLSALKTLHPVMSQGDQHHLYNTAARALATAKRRGDSRFIDYWSGQPIVSMEILSLPLVRLPIEKPMSVLSHRHSDVTPILTGMTDPFLYNPRKLMSGQGQALLVQNEPFEVVVTLRNPFVFDLELSSLALSTSGIQVEIKHMAMIVPANSYHPVTIIGKPLEAGNLTIRGCIVQAPGGASREFTLPLSTEEEEQKQSRRRSTIECEVGRSKRTGLESRPWEKDAKRMSGTGTTTPAKNTTRYLQCKVVPEQPLLRIRRTSLTHGAVMLYNGEMSSIRITFENVSSLPIDFLRLTFDDSTIAPAQQALADGELSVFDTYETEYDLIHRPVFTWDNNWNKEELGPGEKTGVTVNCFGKVGCTNGIINVAYSYIHRKQATLHEPQEVFHTRQLSYPVLVTVYHMLECHAMDILPYSADSVANVLEQDGTESDKAKSRKVLMSVDDVADWCIFSIEVRNTYGLPFEVTFQRDQPDSDSGSTTTLVPPGSTSRIVLPVRKFRLSEDHVAQPIPTLSDRQYVVAKSNLTSAEEKIQRELFWYREELFKYVHGRWKETGGTRSGDMSLRQQRMTRPMLEALRTETARVHMSLVYYKGDDPNSEPEKVSYDGSGKWIPPSNTFIYLQTRVTNLSPCPLILTVDLSMKPAQHIIYEGVLTDIPVGRLECGTSRDIETPVAFMSSGRFELAADVRILGQSRERHRVGQGQLRAIVEMAST